MVGIPPIYGDEWELIYHCYTIPTLLRNHWDLVFTWIKKTIHNMKGSESIRDDQSFNGYFIMFHHWKLGWLATGAHRLSSNWFLIWKVNAQIPQPTNAISYVVVCQFAPCMTPWQNLHWFLWRWLTIDRNMMVSHKCSLSTPWWWPTAKNMSPCPTTHCCRSGFPPIIPLNPLCIST